MGHLEMRFAPARSPAILLLELELHVCGKREPVERELNGLAGVLAAEVLVRELRQVARVRLGAPERPLRERIVALTRLFASTQAEFDRVRNANGSPGGLARAYGYLLTGLLGHCRVPGREADPADRLFCELARSLYEQVARWPAALGAASVGARGCEIVLRAEHDLTALQAAIAGQR